MSLLVHDENSSGFLRILLAVKLTKIIFRIARIELDLKKFELGSGRNSYSSLVKKTQLSVITKFSHFCQFKSIFECFMVYFCHFQEDVVAI
jgi:hypothetical protein